MTDLLNGVVFLNGIRCAPGITQESFLAAASGTVRVTANAQARAAWVSFRRMVEVDGTPFAVELQFVKGVASAVFLRPLLHYPPNVTPEQMQLLRRNACDSWLYARLGAPKEQTPGRTRYLFPWGEASASSSLDPREEYSGGMICLEYKEQR